MSCAINDRVRQVIFSFTEEKNRYLYLEGLSGGINRTKWQNFFKGKQDCSLDMLEFICRAFPDFALYVACGIGSFPSGYLPLPPKNGVELRRDSSGVVSNLARVDYFSSIQIPFEFGYVGKGPDELSFNILLVYGVEPILARKLTRRFTVDITSKVPHEFAFISSFWISEWISENSSTCC